MKETKKITEKDIDNVCNAFCVIAKFKNKLELEIEYYKKEINYLTQLLKSTENDISFEEYILKNDKRINKDYMRFQLKNNKELKRLLEEEISIFEEDFEFYKTLSEYYKEIFLKLK